jgi:hypothetical protein
MKQQQMSVLEWRQSHPEIVQVFYSKYYEQSKDRIRERRRLRYRENQEYTKQIRLQKCS